MSINHPLEILIGSGLLLYGLYRLWKIGDLVRRQFAKDSWTLTTGEVYDREVKVIRGSKGGKSFEPIISYRYTVMGKEFKNTISLGYTLFRRNAEDSIAVVKRNIDVHYNPEKPKEHISSEEKVRVMNVFNTLIILFFSLGLLYGILFGSPTTGTVHFPK